jgi:hypothetical protein
VDDWPHFIVFDFVGFDHYNYIEIETSKQGKTKLQKKNINFLISKIGLNIQIVYCLFPFFYNLIPLIYLLFFWPPFV